MFCLCSPGFDIFLVEEVVRDCCLMLLRDGILYLHILSPNRTTFYWTKSEPTILGRMKIVRQHFNTIVCSVFCGSVLFHVEQAVIKTKWFLGMTFYNNRCKDTFIMIILYESILNLILNS